MVTLLAIRFIGAILIIISCSSVGFIEKYRHGIRIKEIENFIKCMNIFSVEICYSYDNIYDALEKVVNYGTETNKNILQSVKNKVLNSDGIPISHIWVNEFNKLNSAIYKDEEIEIIKHFGDLLGTGSAEIQGENIENLNKQLNIILDNLKKDTPKILSFCKIGIYAGIIIVVLLI